VASISAVTSASVSTAVDSVLTARRWLGVNPRTGRDHLPSNRAGGRYRLEDVLLDANLFRRLRVRSQVKAADAGSADAEAAGIADLQQALSLVTGVPFSDRRDQGYAWLTDDVMGTFVAMVCDSADIVSTHLLAVDDVNGAAAAAEIGMLAGNGNALNPYMNYIRACMSAGRQAEARHTIQRMVSAGGGAVEEDFPTDIYAELRRQGWVS
jgi:hypothetical protein